MSLPTAHRPEGNNQPPRNSQLTDLKNMNAILELVLWKV